MTCFVQAASVMQPHLSGPAGQRTSDARPRGRRRGSRSRAGPSDLAQSGPGSLSAAVPVLHGPCMSEQLPQHLPAGGSAPLHAASCSALATAPAEQPGPSRLSWFAEGMSDAAQAGMSTLSWFAVVHTFCLQTPVPRPATSCCCTFHLTFQLQAVHTQELVRTIPEQ